MADYVTINVNNFTGRQIYLAVQYHTFNCINKWIHFLTDIETSTEKLFDNKANSLELNYGSNTFKYYIDQSQTSTIYLATQPINEIPDYKTTLFIYDTIEIIHNGDFFEIIDNEVIFTGQFKHYNIDYFGMLLQMESNGVKIGFIDDLCRRDVLHFLSRLPTPFDLYKTPLSTDLAYRWFSPAWMAPGNVWEDAIKHGLSKIARRTLKYHTPGNKTTCKFGKASNDAIAITETNNTIHGQIVRDFTINNINTISAIRGTLFPEMIVIDLSKTDSYYLDPKNIAPTLQSGALLAAAINRGVLYDLKLWAPENYKPEIPGIYQDNQYYQSNAQNFNQFNHYSHLMHELSINKLSNAFCYDEYFNQNTSLNVEGMVNDDDAIAEINLLPF